MAGRKLVFKKAQVIFKVFFSIAMLVIIAVSPFLWGCSVKDNVAAGTEVTLDNDESTNLSESQASSDTTAPPVEVSEKKNYYVSQSSEFENYSFICPDNWVLYESGQGSRVMLKNSNSVDSKMESIFIFIDDVSSNEELKDDESVISIYNLLLEGDPTVNMADEKTVSINGADAPLISYEYLSSLDTGTTSEGTNCIDCFTFFRNGNYVYAIKYIGRGISTDGAQQTFSNFVSSFKLDSQVIQ